MFLVAQQLKSLHTNSQDNIGFDVAKCAAQLLYGPLLVSSPDCRARQEAVLSSLPPKAVLPPGQRAGQVRHAGPSHPGHVYRGEYINVGQVVIYYDSVFRSLKLLRRSFCPRRSCGSGKRLQLRPGPGRRPPGPGTRRSPRPELWRPSPLLQMTPSASEAATFFPLSLPDNYCDFDFISLITENFQKSVVFICFG